MNRMEKFNELITIVILDFLFAFTDFTTTSSTRTANGWFIIALFYFQSLVNITFISFSLGRFYRFHFFRRLLSSRKILKTVQIFSTSSVLNNTLTAGPLLKLSKQERETMEKAVSKKVIEYQDFEEQKQSDAKLHIINETDENFDDLVDKGHQKDLAIKQAHDKKLN